MSVAVSKFIMDLALHFPPKHTRPEQETAWVRSMAEALRGYSAIVLDEAARHIIGTRKYTTFPLASECRDACETAHKRRENIARAQTLPSLQRSAGEDEWSSERVKLAYELIKSGLGKQAANDNPCWVLALWHFCRKHQRLPAGHEVERCKKDAREFDQTYADCVRGNGGECSSALEKLGASMLKKREGLRAEVLGK